MNVYVDREQTEAKHFILRGYLQELAFKVLRGWDIAYVDGFSGPWESKTDDFSDTSFMIAIQVLKEAQRTITQQTSTRRKIKCFFSEKSAAAYHQMAGAVAPFHQPAEGFEIKTFQGEFVDAVEGRRVRLSKSISVVSLLKRSHTVGAQIKVTALAPPVSVA